MLWTRNANSGKTFWVLDKLDHLPQYKYDTHMLYMSGTTERLLTVYDY